MGADLMIISRGQPSALDALPLAQRSAVCAGAMGLLAKLASRSRDRANSIDIKCGGIYLINSLLLREY